jgi:hypothetical protein
MEQLFETILFPNDAGVSNSLFVANSIVHAQVGRLLKSILDVIVEAKIYVNPLGPARVDRKWINRKSRWLILVGLVFDKRLMLETVMDAPETLVRLTPVKYEVLLMRRCAVSMLTTIWASFAALP